VRAVDNPPNPWRSAHTELLAPEPLQAPQVFEEESRSILSENDSPDVPFRFSVNPYRGCHHGCAYCYARPTHQWLDFGAGTDFERKLVVKVNAPELLRRELGRRQTELAAEVLAFSGVTDCYQPLEATYGLTRRCLEVCRDVRQHVGIITKGALVARDAALLGEVHRAASAVVHFSVPTDDEHDARALEPYAPTPQRRLDAMAAVAAQGVPVGVSVSPLIPGWNDHRIPSVLQAAKAHGASYAWMILLRLPREVHDVFTARVREELPLRADKILSLLGQVRGDGGLQESRFGKRMRGEGARWQMAEDLFKLWCKKLGLKMRTERPQPAPRPRQRGLFDGV
jgi:DNA repair photolyase